ncbi:MAG: hypothetical protein FWC80_05655 [Firmicutes bacterium]|nr:hypothetical protein [Bacillota bacterium]
MKKVKLILLSLLLTITTTVVFTGCSNYSQNPFSQRVLSLMQNVRINMNNVTAFGMAETTLQDVSIHTLVTINEQNQVDEVIFVREDEHEIRQESIGVLTNLFTHGEFTFVQYTSENALWHGYISFETRFRFSANFTSQTFIIHHESGRVFALADFFLDSDNIWNQHVFVSAGIMAVPVSWNIYDYYSLSVDSDYNLNFIHLNPNQAIVIDNARVDKFGNSVLFTSSNINEVTPHAVFTYGMHFVCPLNIIYRSQVVAGRRQTTHYLNQNREWIPISKDFNTALGLIRSESSSRWNWNEVRRNYVHMNGQLIEIHGNSVYLVNDYIFVFREGAGLFRVDIDWGSQWLYRTETHSLMAHSSFWREGDLIVEIMGAIENRQYIVSFDGQKVSTQYLETITFQGNALVIINPIN